MSEQQTRTADSHTDETKDDRHTDGTKDDRMQVAALETDNRNTHLANE